MNVMNVEPNGRKPRKTNQRRATHLCRCGNPVGRETLSPVGSCHDTPEGDPSANIIRGSTNVRRESGPEQRYDLASIARPKCARPSSIAACFGSTAVSDALGYVRRRNIARQPPPTPSSRSRRSLPRCKPRPATIAAWYCGRRLPVKLWRLRW